MRGSFIWAKGIRRFSRTARRCSTTRNTRREPDRGGACGETASRVPGPRRRRGAAHHRGAPAGATPDRGECRRPARRRSPQEQARDRRADRRVEPQPAVARLSASSQRPQPPPAGPAQIEVAEESATTSSDQNHFGSNARTDPVDMSLAPERFKVQFTITARRGTSFARFRT